MTEIKESLKNAEICIQSAIRRLKISAYDIKDPEKLKECRDLIEKDKQALELIRHLIGRVSED